MSKKPSCCSGPQPQPCCGGEPEVSRPTNTHQQQSCCAPETCCPPKTRVDVLFWGCLLVVLGLYGVAAGWPAELVRYPKLEVMAHAVFHTVNAMWWGVLAGAVFVGVMSKVPREFVMSVLGQGGSMSGILRATGAGVLLDLCSHGILLVAAKLYERGASAGQVIAFLLASPWNSFSLTLVLVSLIGLYWTLTFIVLSMLIAWVTGWVFDRLVHRGVLPSNPNRVDLPPDFQFWAQAKIQLKQVNWSAGVLKDVLFVGIKESKMTVRWLLLGIVLSAVLKLVLNPDQFQSFFGPTLLGLMITLGVATVLEVCSEGATPIAADILTRAQAPGNAFAFLMAGVATDYTEVMVLRETTKSWKLALFLPLITVPQVIVVAWIININI